MTSLCTIATPAPTSEWVKDADGFETRTHRLIGSGVRCRLDEPGAAQAVVVGDASQAAATRLLRLPWDTRAPDGAVARIDEGEWVGTFWRIPSAAGADQKKELRVRVEQVSEPEGWGTWVSA